MVTLLLDKSVLEDLTLKELGASRGKYQLLATEVLLLEILGDLRYQDGRTKILSKKLRSSRFHVNMPSDLLCASELLGKSVPMERTPVLEDFEARGSGSAAYILPSEWENALRRWADGNFDARDLEDARAWGNGIKDIPLEDFRRAVRRALPREQHPSSVDDIGSAFESALRRSEMQHWLLDAVLNSLSVPEEWIELIRRRWSAGGLWLPRDAPYTSFCTRILFVLADAVISQFIGTRRTNFVDAQYLMYLPFCDFFASGDKVHASLFPFISMPGQEFLSSRDLKERLARSSNMEGSA